MYQSGGALAMSTTINAMLTLRRSLTERQITSEETDWLELSSHASVSRLTRSENETLGFN
ncbi:Flp pilus assembly CpaF family ATPase [Agrobacterium tumefaciens]|nr:Flp pilus assembly CpaF family ATPase [Agrobacterium radiobacter]MBB4450184.1 Flp pilus assembly CpaF family ATPase [Agrobacterium radiobacter]